MRTSVLLGRLATATDVGDAWARLAVRSGRLARRTLPSRVPAFLAGGLATASLAASVLVLHPAPTRMLGRLHGAETFTTVLDRCCSDDPGAELPTGVFRLELAGMGAPLEVTYSDVDGSGTLSQGDIVRTITRAGRR